MGNVMSVIQHVLSLGVIVIPAILVHEFGHLLMAKVHGLHVKEFGVGFPPKILTMFKWGETAFTLNALPLGGFVNLDEKGVDKELEGRFLENQSTWVKTLVYLAGATANIAFVWLISVTLFLVGAPKTPFIVTGVTGESMFQMGDVILAMDGIEVNAFTSNYTFPNINTSDGSVDFMIERYGERLSLSIPALSDTLSIEDLNVVVSPLPNLQIVEIDENQRAYQSGLRVGDVITHIDYRRVVGSEELSLATSLLAGERADVSYLRDNQSYTINMIIPDQKANEYWGAVFSNSYPTQRYSLLESISRGTQYFAFSISEVLSLPESTISAEDESMRPVGIIGLGQISVRVVEQSIATRSLFGVLTLSIALNVSLGIFNLLPIPILDGGEILLIWTEELMGRKMSEKIKSRIKMASVIVLLVVFVGISLLDIFVPVFN